MITFNSWTNLKALIIKKNIKLQYHQYEYFYKIFAQENGATYCTELWTDTTKVEGIDVTQNDIDLADFIANYKSDSNESIDPKDSEGKVYTRAESRPLYCTTYFTSCGDTVGATPSIGTGPRMHWDASIASGWVDDENGAPDGMKQFSVIIQFCDSIWLKEGTVYYMNATKNSYLDMEVLCPNGGYYMYMGQIYQNTTGSDLVVDHYLMKHPIQDSVPMGDELNTESCSQELPSYLKFKLTATVPESDVTSYGYMEIETYRERTVVIG